MKLIVAPCGSRKSVYDAWSGVLVSPATTVRTPAMLNERISPPPQVFTGTTTPRLARRPRTSSAGLALTPLGMDCSMDREKIHRFVEILHLRGLAAPRFERGVAVGRALERETK
jgi:hypothetical protein